MYTPLKITTEYTLLHSLIKVSDLITFLLANNIKACAICDDNLYGSLDFYNSCRNNNIKPIIGLCITLNDLELYLYAINYQGYKNLLKIHTIKEERTLAIIDLEKYCSDLLVIVPYKSKELWPYLSFYNYLYLGFSNNFEANNALIITKNIVYVNDIRALKLEDVKYLNYLDDLRKEERIDYHNNYYQVLDIIDEDKINEIVNLINLEIPYHNRYIPQYNPNIDPFLFLKNLSLKGITKRLNGNVSEIYLKRLDHELNIIKEMGYVDYFLIVYDYVLFAKKNNILVGPGRGSAAGSLVSFSIGITDIDPIKYNLLFERFLNPARVTMPDIDIDFDATKRGEVIDYVKNKYGVNKVALGLTFNTFKSKLVLREVGKILQVNPDLIDKFVHVIDASKTLKDNLSNNLVKSYLRSYKELQKVYKVSLHLEGLKRNISTHASGVVISSVDLDEIIPIHYSNGELITGVAMDYLENIGLFKMDFLGLKNLTTIADILEVIGKNVLKAIDLNDPKVYELFIEAKTDGIFQFETPAMKNLLGKLQPNSFNDLIAAVALGRPGSREQAPAFIKRKKGLEPVTYLHPDLESILRDTYGILIYQEQVIAILGKIAGYSYQEADIIRRAIAKKKEGTLIAERDKFLKKAMSKGYSENIALTIYNLIAKFAGYGFNKSHSVAYALVAYQMAYLKTYYTEEFLIVGLNEASSSKEFASLFTYLKGRGIKLVKPSINSPYLDYYIENRKLVLPLRIIKNIPRELAKKIIDLQGNGYTDIFDFAAKTRDFMTPAIMENLIRAGAMDCFTLNHQTLVNNIESALNYGAIADATTMISKPKLIEYPEYNSDTLRIDEVNSYGFYITNHPASKYNDPNIIKLNNLKNYLFKRIKCIIYIEKISKIKTKNNEDMAFVVGSDETGMADFTIFPTTFARFASIKTGAVIEVYGEVQRRFDKIQIIVNNIKELS